MKQLLRTLLLLTSIISDLALAQSDPRTLRYAADVAETAGIGQLANSKLDFGSREIRIWTDASSGTVIPSEMLQLKIDETGAVAGAIWVYFPTDMSWESRRQASRFDRDLRARCGALVVGAAVSVCVAKYNNPPDWSALYARLKALDVETLPDESELPRFNSGVLDGFVLIVESRVGSAYRTISYANPQFRPGEEGAKATAISHEARKMFNAR